MERSRVRISKIEVSTNGRNTIMHTDDNLDIVINLNDKNKVRKELCKEYADKFNLEDVYLYFSYTEID